MYLRFSVSGSHQCGKVRLSFTHIHTAFSIDTLQCVCVKKNIDTSQVQETRAKMKYLQNMEQWLISPYNKGGIHQTLYLGIKGIAFCTFWKFLDDIFEPFHGSFDLQWIATSIRFTVLERRDKKQI